MEFRRVEVNVESLNTYGSLFAECFPGATHLDSRYLAWLYRDNPVGRVVGFDAWEGDELAAHYVCIPVDLQVHRRPVRGLLSLNTATRPAFQGKGLFTKLAELCYAAGAQEGFECIYGVANAHSTPGFLRKLGFSLVGPLEARIGVAWPEFSFGDLSQSTEEFRRIWTKASMAWRVSCPSNLISLTRKEGRGWLASASARKFGVRAVAEIPDYGAEFDEHGGNMFCFGKLFIGLVPREYGRLSGYIDIPARLRPSPLNLIYRDLSGELAVPAVNHVMLSFLDFDAY